VGEVVTPVEPMIDAHTTSAPEATGRPVAPALEATGLVRSYGDVRVVDIDHLKVEAGEMLAVLGPNGAGKSTLFRLLALLESPDSGRISHFGMPVSHRDLAARRRTGTVFQRPFLFQGKVHSNVSYGLRLRRLPRAEIRERVARALELAGVAGLAKADVRRLSGGEAQRVALARALVLEPDILFLDEPSSNLDPGLRRRFRDDLRRIVEQSGTTAVLITHDRTEAMSLAHRIVLMKEGRVVQQGPAEEVYSRPRDAFVADYMGVETIWRGFVEHEVDGLCSVRVSGSHVVEALAEAEVGEEVGVAVRPEDVVIARATQGEPPATSARNRWSGAVVSVRVSGPLADIWIDLDGVLLHAVVTRPSVLELGIEPGARVLASVKATAVHLLTDREEGYH